MIYNESYTSLERIILYLILRYFPDLKNLFLKFLENVAVA